MPDIAAGGIAVFADALCRVIWRARTGMTFVTETQMQQAMTELFAAERIEARPQVVLGPRERPDFMVGWHECPGIAVELKRAGTAAALTRQITRYAGHREVGAVVVVTNRVRHRNIPPVINGKPVRVVCLASVAG